jgi:glutathione S-transferase
VKPATLITIPFSHYCEKARWALDYAGVSYVEDGHVPGLHRVATRRAGSAAGSVPVLLVDDRALTDSTDIVAYADRAARPGRELSLEDPRGQADVEALEKQLDRELGPHIRRVLYFYLLPRPRLVFGLADQRTPGWERALLRGTFPLLRIAMRRAMRIEERTALESRDRTFRVLDAMEARLSDGRRYLVGDRFTAADMTLAALAGPAVQPREHPVRFPAMSALPPGAVKLLEDVQARPIAAYLRRMYADHRR